MQSNMHNIAILGAGRVGTALARRALSAGFEVRVATSRPAAENAVMLQIVAPGAIVASAEDAVAASDIIVLALPLSKYRNLKPELLQDKIVVDAMNYWAPTDGTLAEFEGATSSSEVVQRFLKGARLVRSFNHMGYHEIEDSARPDGHAERRAMAVAGDDAQANLIVAAFIDRLGFDPVISGGLASSRLFAGGTPIFGAAMTRIEIQQHLGPLSHNPA
ncbi:NADPH-dependent F420 reductase [Ensifer adhaerens]|uniref:NADPH-dependent F420 reductase n=1 Tax=Ensifer adhaerens TaxID=106592 RepID=UPI0019D4CD66|nr:NADPH-dependent F420 reductase [Ensifer adhaerens]MDF8357634.1 NADPH-dependent F420 reductase [Ensifer adhaerens]